MTPDANEIKKRIDLVEYLASHGIELRPVGASGEYRGRCPFHEEREPSFQVNRHKGLWHCFGCGAGGDIISFVRRREGVGFREALALLSATPEMPRGCIRKSVADYWHKCLAGSPSALAYLKRRGIHFPEIITRYGIGFAPGRTRTRDHLLAEGFGREEIEAKGLANHRGLDSFFGRVTFPLVEDGKAVNIYGRSLSDHYRHMYLPGRRDVVFNLENSKGEEVVVTESIIDALSLIALGFENAVSVLSAHLTGRQAELLAARFSRIAIVFDGDPAGESGAVSAAATLGERGAQTHIVRLPTGEDINSLLTQGTGRQDIQNFLEGKS